jgi:hypothetical protein
VNYAIEEEKGTDYYLGRISTGAKLRDFPEINSDAEFESLRFFQAEVPNTVASESCKLTVLVGKVGALSLISRIFTFILMVLKKSLNDVSAATSKCNIQSLEYLHNSSLFIVLFV